MSVRIADKIGYALILFTILMIHSDDWFRTFSTTISNIAHSQSMSKYDNN